MDNIPVWLGTALVGAVIAAAGYVLKNAIEGVLKWGAIRRVRRAKLVALQSLLLASKNVFDIQNELVDRLCEIIETQREFSSSKPLSYDEILARGYAQLDEQQKLEHGIIRHYTSNCLLPLNTKMIEWLSEDEYFKGARGRGDANKLSVELPKLHSHLILWRAKYPFWIPSKPERAIVYMADEHGHGIEFPKGIDGLIGRITGVSIPKESGT